MDRGRVGLMRRAGVLSRHFGLSGRNLNGRLRGGGGPGVLDDLSRRVGVLAKRAATAPSRVGVVCHDAADYQSDTFGEALVDPLTTMDPERGELRVHRHSSTGSAAGFS
ncbi:hypothetical protein DMB66_54635 [Actinoplanes sp. ATCC 53533]|nr:hypothetical protein DMB66_54635 [Actinoplanes sp. ATCC 53533]